MNFCIKDWNELRQALTIRGLSPWMSKTERELDIATRDPHGFEPLYDAMMMLNTIAVYSYGGNIDEPCVICFLEAKRALCKCEVCSSELDWTNRIAEHELDKARALHLLSPAS